MSSVWLSISWFVVCLPLGRCFSRRPLLIFLKVILRTKTSCRNFESLTDQNAPSPEGLADRLIVEAVESEPDDHGVWFWRVHAFTQKIIQLNMFYFLDQPQKLLLTSPLRGQGQVQVICLFLEPSSEVLQCSGRCHFCSSKLLAALGDMSTSFTREVMSNTRKGNYREKHPVSK